MVKILDRYLTVEVLGPFFLGIVGFVLVMTVDLLFTFVDLIINKGVPLLSVVKLLIFKLPAILILTYPVATLFGVAMAIGRLAHDNEISALRTSGISFFRIAVPIIVISLIISGISYFTNEKLVPIANRESSKIIRQIVTRHPLPDIRQNVFFKDAYNRYFYVRKMDTKDKTLQDIMVYELYSGKLPQVITAKSAKLDDLLLTLSSGVIHKFDKKGRLEYEATFKEMDLNLAESPITVGEQKTAQEMDIQELKSKIESFKKGGISTKSLQTDLYMKYSVPLTCFVFALIGIPLALPGIRGARGWGMILTIVLMFTFYVFASVFRSLGRGGILTPMLAAWMPQMLFAALGVILLFREGHYK